MDKVTEIELKYEVLNPENLQNFLQSLTFQNTKRVKDIYLDTLNGDLYQRGIFIRIRNNKTLDFKFKLEEIRKDAMKIQLAYYNCDEYNFKLPLTKSSLGKLNEVIELLNLKPVKKADLNEFKKVNRLVESAIVDRQRTTYLKSGLTIEMDNIKGLGNHMEIEHLLQPGENPEVIKNQIKEFLGELDVVPRNVGYCELYWRKKNFDLYLKGKFILDEDFKKYRKTT